MANRLIKIILIVSFCSGSIATLKPVSETGITLNLSKARRLITWGGLGSGLFGILFGTREARLLGGVLGLGSHFVAESLRQIESEWMATYAGCLMGYSISIDSQLAACAAGASIVYFDRHFL